MFIRCLFAVWMTLSTLAVGVVVFGPYTHTPDLRPALEFTTGLTVAIGIIGVVWRWALDIS